MNKELCLAITLAILFNNIISAQLKQLKARKQFNAINGIQETVEHRN